MKKLIRCLIWFKNLLTLFHTDLRHVVSILLKKEMFIQTNHVFYAFFAAERLDSANLTGFQLDRSCQSQCKNLVIGFEYQQILEHLPSQRERKQVT